jgi:uncharacterized membrane protein YeaQ/YmgE (transglycosylase-associated protein family)
MDAGEMVTTAAAAMLSGWVAERVIDTGVRVRGIAPLAGLFGLYVGQWVWASGGWDSGPRVAGCPIVPAVVGAFGVCALLKLVALGFAGPRR